MHMHIQYAYPYEYSWAPLRFLEFSSVSNCESQDTVLFAYEYSWARLRFLEFSSVSNCESQDTVLFGSVVGRVCIHSFKLGTITVVRVYFFGVQRTKTRP
jgi:hypothetical protein